MIQKPPALPRIALIASLMLALLGGCTRHVVVSDQFPPPVMQKKPYRVGLLLEPEFAQVVHEQELETGGDWRIELGAANAALFRQLVAGMFQKAVEVDRKAAGEAVDAVLRPTLTDFQFSTPEQNATDYYEAWLAYRIAVHGPDGRELAHWPLKAYGRSQERALAAGASLEAATQNALRDAAAGMALDFLRQPAVMAALSGSPVVPGSAQDPEADPQSARRSAPQAEAEAEADPAAAAGAHAVSARATRAPAPSRPATGAGRRAAGDDQGSPAESSP